MALGGFGTLLAILDQFLYLARYLSLIQEELELLVEVGGFGTEILRELLVFENHFGKLLNLSLTMLMFLLLLIYLIHDKMRFAFRSLLIALHQPPLPHLPPHPDGLPLDLLNDAGLREHL